MAFKDLRGLTYVGVGILALWLAIVVFIAHALSGFLETMVVNGMKIAWVYLFLWYSGFLFVGLIIFVWMLGIFKR